MRPDDAFKLYKRLFVKHNIVHILYGKVGFYHAIPTSLYRETIIMLLPCETLFRCCRDHFAIYKYCSSAVMIICRDSQYDHN